MTGVAEIFENKSLFLSLKSISMNNWRCFWVWNDAGINKVQSHDQNLDRLRRAHEMINYFLLKNEV